MAMDMAVSTTVIPKLASSEQMTQAVWSLIFGTAASPKAEQEPNPVGGTPSQPPGNLQQLWVAVRKLLSSAAFAG